MVVWSSGLLFVVVLVVWSSGWCVVVDGCVE